MKYRTLGSAGVKVSPLCLGSVNFSYRTEEDDAIRIIHRALDAGINFLDTANVYGKTPGASEDVVGKALKGRRHKVVLATKVFNPMGDGPNERGSHRVHIRHQVEASLRRLQTDYIDLYQLHCPDPTTPLEETLSALTDLVRQGKVLYLGTSNFAGWQLVEGQWIAQRRNLERFVCEQAFYNLLHRKVEKDLFPVCQKYGIGVILWSPLGSGFLTGKYRKNEPLPPDSRAVHENWGMDSPEVKHRLDGVARLKPLAEARGKTLSQFSLAWTLANPVVTAPIIGPRTIEHLEDNLGALDFALTLEEMAAVDEIVPPGTSTWDRR